MAEALLTINFCSFSECRDFSFDEIIINNVHFSTKKGKIEIKIPFNKYEQYLGRKVCHYKLVRKEYENEENEESEDNEESEENEINDLFEVYLGKNIGYCFIDDFGTTFEFLFLKRDEKIKNFLEKKIIIKKEYFYKKKIKIIPNNIDNIDRANLLLINCPINVIIKINKNKKIYVRKIYPCINVFSSGNSFQICFHNDNLEDFVFRETKDIEELNFDKEYNIYNEKVNKIFDVLFNEMKNNNSNTNLDKILLNLYGKEKKDLEKLIFKMLNFGKNIFEEELNKECYIDFIFKIILFMYINYYKSKKEIQINDIRNIYDKLIINKNKICNDFSLKIYEKIYLLIELYSSKIIFKDDYIINYLNINDIQKYSPIYYAYEFLNDFIKELDSESNFY